VRKLGLPRRSVLIEATRIGELSKEELIAGYREQRKETNRCREEKKRYRDEVLWLKKKQEELIAFGVVLGGLATIGLLVKLTQGRNRR
jgi:hypothetical protein